MANEWRRCRTSFSSVPAFTLCERDTVDCVKRKQKMYRMTNEALSVFLSHVIYHWTVGGTMMVFDSHCVDQSILLFLHHSRLEGSKNKVVEI